jgi:gas vesicle protein
MGNENSNRSGEMLRFAAGWRRIAAPQPEPDPQPDIVVDVVRPDDLVSLSVAGFDVELVEGESPVLRATSIDARLVVGFTYQHLGEEAIYEEEDAAEVDPPVGAIPARGSRLVFALSETDLVKFSTAGILDAIGRLPLVVHPLAKPRSGPTPVPPTGPIIHLPDDIVAVPGAGGVVFTGATTRTRVEEMSPGMALASKARGLRRVRDLLTYSSGTAVRLDDDLIDGIVADPGLIFPDRPIRIPKRPTLSRPTERLETTIEAPFRLQISPSNLGGWAHAISPVSAEGAPHRIELWHTRLGVRPEIEGPPTVDERSSPQRIIRAVWTRDREAMPDWETLKQPLHENVPFRMSLDSADRHMLVRQSAETWVGVDGAIGPQPVEARGLWLSSLGAWLDLNGRWNTTPYDDSGISAVIGWEHIAPIGRDQYVRVEYPGYLFPFGHKTSLIKITERKMKKASPSIASLYQRKFLQIGEPVRFYEQADLPFSEVRLAPTVTPTLDPEPTGQEEGSFFFPVVDGQQFRFIFHCVDREGRRVRLQAPLLWVAAAFQGFGDVEDEYVDDPAASHVPAVGQEVAFAPVAKGGDTLLPTNTLHFAGTAQQGTSVPNMAGADVLIPAVERLSPVGGIAISYAQAYLDHGFGGTANAGEVWAKVTTPPELKFGDAGAGSDKAGGFIQPNLMVDGLSRIKGTIGDVDSVATGGFDPAAFLAQLSLPKLFGIVHLLDILDAVGVDLDQAPSIVTETLERIEAFIADLERAKAMVEEAVAEAQKLVDRATGKAQELQDQADAALLAAEDLKTEIEDTVDEILEALDDLVNAAKEDIEDALDDVLDDLRDGIGQIRVVAPQLPPLIGQRLLGLADVLDKVANAADLIDDLFNFLNGLAGGSIDFTFSFEWKPKMKSWPATDPILELEEDSFVLAVEGRASGQDGMKVDALAELRDFKLNLLPGADLVKFKFDHLSFRAGSTGKPDVDVVLNEIEFVGILGFVEVLRELIPFDGFSDPPFLEVTAEGLTAGFTQALPSVAVGVFNLSNISLGADVQVPFLGKAVTVGFDFCTRDRPFTLAVLFIGGGGWFGIRLSPDGLDVLELGLEAGAVLAVDFGVASGSISAMLGIYMRLEADEGSLAGYFRLRGEVDVLGLISASIELYLELLYEFATGKMVGSASLTIEVDVLFFSTSVTIHAERQFAGSNGDPNFLDVMGLEPDGTSPAWSEYCLAFAGA